MSIDQYQSKHLLLSSLQDLCNEFNKGNYTPILEADVAAFLYHRIITLGCLPRNIFVDTRVCGIEGKDWKYDLVLGKLNELHACIQPVLIAQIKAFQRWGLSHQQMRRRFGGIINNDIPALIEANRILSNGCYEVIADFFHTSQSHGYLTGTWYGKRRKDLLVEKCEFHGISLIWVRPSRSGDLTVEQLV